MRRVSLCLAFPFVLACGLVGPDKTKFQVQGQITVADDGSPIPGASVQFKHCVTESILSCNWQAVAPRATTDAQGHYAVSYVHSGYCGHILFGLVVNAPGFAERSIWSTDDPHIVCTEEIQTIDVQLEP